jgi:8-oxo-dGTP diphosphatase
VEATTGPDWARHSNIIGVHLVLERDGSVLLGRRLNSRFGTGHYHVPAGHLEAGESVTGCAVREAREELDIGVAPEDLELVHVLHLHALEDGLDRIQLFLRVRAHTGTIRRAEPEKCAGWEWHPYDALPSPLVYYTGTALEAIRAGRPYSEYGWQRVH